MLALGLSSKREITRIAVRVRAAMAAQTMEQGRYLGGRPPYGYRLADAGPHTNKAHAAWGRRAHRLEPDPVTAPVVRWMFTQHPQPSRQEPDQRGQECAVGPSPAGAGDRRAAARRPRAVARATPRSCKPTTRPSRTSRHILDDERDAHRATVTDTQQIRRKPVLGGLINEYTRAS